MALSQGFRGTDSRPVWAPVRPCLSVPARTYHSGAGVGPHPCSVYPEASTRISASNPPERDPVIHAPTHAWPGRAMSCADRYERVGGCDRKSDAP